MWISKKKYNNMKNYIRFLQAKEGNLLKENAALKNDKNILLNIINPDIMGLDFPNTKERGQGEPDTPNNMSDLLF